MAVAWIVPVLTDLNNYLVGAQVTAINTAALATGAGQTDRFTEARLSVVQRIRMKIVSCAGNVLSATTNSIPPSLKMGACLLIIQALQTSIPSLKLTEDQVRLVESFEEDLTAVAACDLAVEEPTDPLDPPVEQTSGAVELVSSTTRRATRDTLKGL